MEVTHTARGFELVKFADIYNEPCTLQESSLADRHAIWFGAGDNRMHLDANLLGQLLPHIDRMLGATLTTENAALAARVGALEGAVLEAAVWFEMYADDHTAKAAVAHSEDETSAREAKAARNAERAAKLRAALAGDPS